jgi:8-oxo-dGTP pyrophosphatase MutT (NUDIX family)
VAEPFFEQIRARLKDRPSKIFSEFPEREAQRAASVLVPLYLKAGEPYVVLTKRSEQLTQHAGQISFPGGGRDPGDVDATATALREAEEEIGLDRQRVDILGPLDLLDTITSFRVSPFVGAIPAGYPFRAEKEEVAEIIQLPLRGFLSPKVLTIEQRLVFGVLRQIYGYTVEGYLVWGATGRILHGFLELIQGLL